MSNRLPSEDSLNEAKKQSVSHRERAKTFAEMAVVGFEVGPFNEIARYSLFGTALATTGSPLTAAIAYGASTLAIEGSAAVATAPLLNGDKANIFTRKVSNKLLEANIDPKVAMNPIVQAGVATYGGVSLSMALNKIKSPDITKEKNRRHGLKVSAALGALCTAEGVLIGESITHPSTGTIGAATIAVGGLYMFTKWARNRFSQNDQEQSEEYENSFDARYDLSEKELKELESEMIAHVEASGAEPGVSALWISPNHRFSNFIRTHEASYFPEVAEVSDEDEKNTLFLALVDTRDSSKRVIHGATLMSPTAVKEESEQSSTGFYTIDSLIERDNFSNQDFYDYYKNKGIDISKCLSVETNFRIGEKTESFNGLKSADIAYVAIFQKLISSDPKLGESLIIATINSKQAQSFERVGLRCEPIMGRTDLVTEESELGIDSQPVTLICDEYARDLLIGMNATTPHVVAQ